MAHSKEPWASRPSEHHGEVTEDIIAHGSGNITVASDLSDADARRIIACVNILAGVSTEILERVINAGARLSVFDDPSGGLNCDLVEASDE